MTAAVDSASPASKGLRRLLISVSLRCYAGRSGFAAARCNRLQDHSGARGTCQLQTCASG
jgi:hypothetical protein